MDKQLEYLQRMKEIKEKHGHDKEISHGLADDLLCDILEDLGYKDVVEEYKKLPKYYA